MRPKSNCMSQAKSKAKESFQAGNGMADDQQNEGRTRQGRCQQTAAVVAVACSGGRVVYTQIESGGEKGEGRSPCRAKGERERESQLRKRRRFLDRISAVGKYKDGRDQRDFVLLSPLQHRRRPDTCSNLPQAASTARVERRERSREHDETRKHVSRAAADPANVRTKKKRHLADDRKKLKKETVK